MQHHPALLDHKSCVKIASDDTPSSLCKLANPSLLSLKAKQGHNVCHLCLRSISSVPGLPTMY